MSVPWPGSMRSSQVKSRLLLLLLLLLFVLLLNAGTVLCQDVEDAEASMEDEDMSAGDPADGNTPTSDNPETTPTMDPPVTGEATKASTDAGTILEEKMRLSRTIILIIVGLVVLIIAMTVCSIFIIRRCNTKARKRGLKEEDPYLDDSATEKVPMPMFEEDVPSVLELEMEELDQWMQQDGEATKESMKTI